MSQNPKNTSTFLALHNPIYRNLWMASLISGICVSAHDCAATWVMYRLSTASALFLSLMSTVASLPFFLFTLPAGALADIVDRRKLLCVMKSLARISRGAACVVTESVHGSCLCISDWRRVCFLRTSLDSNGSGGSVERGAAVGSHGRAEHLLTIYPVCTD